MQPELAHASGARKAAPAREGPWSTGTRGAIPFYERLGANLSDWLRYGLNEAEIRRLAGAVGGRS
jgi:hypothetical protein